MKIDETTLYKLAFEVVEDNIEWGVSESGRNFAYFIDGMLALMDKIKLNINEDVNEDVKENEVEKNNPSILGEFLDNYFDEK